MSEFVQFPQQQLPFSKKTKSWRKKHCDWADSKTFFNYSPVRNSIIHKKINYDLLSGILHMEDMMLVINPENIKANFIPSRIQHYPIMNSKLNVLRGEESRRVFDYKVIVTNPNAISEIETTKKNELLNKIQSLIEDQAQSEEEFNAELAKLDDFYTYEWQDIREIRANALLNHYKKELNMPLIFNHGFMDALANSEEMYICDIVGGEPTLERLNPNKVTVFRSGYSNKIEDADVVIIDDYWSPGRIIDTYYDVLTKKDIDYIEKLPNTLGHTDSMDNIDDRAFYINGQLFGDEYSSEYFFNSDIEGEGSLLPYDIAGNIRVLRVFWKSRRKIKKVKSYNIITGEEEFSFYPETYVLKKELGEEEEIFYINEAWEGTKIGSEIYINMRPRVVQYNRLSNPSRCHFGIIGTIYNLNDNKPYSLVDMMKPYNYLYDAIHDRLNKLMAKNWGKIITLDLAKVPAKWDIDKWLYFAKTNNIAVVDSFKEGNIGTSTGVLSGALNNASSGVIDAELGNSIQQHINLLEFLKLEMSEVAGISRQREGQVSNRETVGGVERATLQSSHITEWLFLIHDDVKRRALECFLETAKIALKGRSKKFQYILPDNSIKVMEIDGDEFAECDYGLIVDNSDSTQELKQKIDMLAQAALQNQTLSFSSIMKLYNSSSLAEKQRMIEKNEQEILERQQQSQQQQMEAQQQQLQAESQLREAEMQLKDQLNQRDNETKIQVATISARTNEIEDGIQEPENTEAVKADLLEKIREFDEKLKLDREKLELEKKKHRDTVDLKRSEIAKSNNNDT